MPQFFFHQRRSVMSIVIVFCVCMCTFTPAVWGNEGARKKVQPTAPSSWSWVPDQVSGRLAKAEKIPWKEAADEVLIPRSQMKWPRYLSSLLNTPAWIDLGGEFRVRYEEKTNPSRKGEFGTADQVALRTRVRLGVSGKIFRFLVEGRIHERNSWTQAKDFRLARRVRTTSYNSLALRRFAMLWARASAQIST